MTLLERPLPRLVGMGVREGAEGECWWQFLASCFEGQREGEGGGLSPCLSRLLLCCDGPTSLTSPALFAVSPQLQQKAVASEIFKGKKDNYPQSVPRLFISTRLGEPPPLQCTNPPSAAWSPLSAHTPFAPPSGLQAQMRSTPECCRPWARSPSR